MGHIGYYLQGFTGRANPRRIAAAGYHTVTSSRLVWAASTIGTTPFGPRLPAAHALELQWRSAMMRASLQPAGGCFGRSRSYDRLDPAEKGAVSFFLGQAQAKVFAHDFFGISRFVQLDAYLNYLHQPRKRSRPDFVGFHGKGVAIAAEVKGRSQGYNATLVRNAKKQAANLPSIAGHPTTAAYAQVAYFAGREWCALLDDPPQRRRSAEIDPALLTAAYYAPIVSAIQSHDPYPWRPYDDEIVYLTASFPDIDLNLSIRQDLATLTPSEDRPLGDRASRAQLLYQYVLGLDGAKDLTSAADRWPDDELRFLGGDGVLVELGESWARWPEEQLQ